MKPTKIFTGIPVLFLLLLAAAGCERDLDLDLDNAVFCILDENQAPVAQRQTFSFNSQVKLAVVAKNVASTEVAVPAGWSCEVSVPQRTITIQSPDAPNLEAVNEGEIVVTAKGANGSAVRVSVMVEAVEEAVTLACNEDTADPFSFRLGERKTFTFTASSNVTDVLVAGMPTGWTLASNLKEMKLEIAAPDLPDSETEMAGVVSLTPVSVRGTKGASVSIAVNLNATSPILEFDKAQLWFRHGETQQVRITKRFNVREIDLQHVVCPAGWTLVPDFANEKMTVTSPAVVEAGTERGGRIVIPIVSESGELAQTGLDVVLGICDAADLLALGEAVAEGRGLDGQFAAGGEVRLFADVDLSTSDRDVIIGAEEKPFTGTFNGGGHTITLGIAAAGADAGLFHLLGEGAVVKDLTLAGAIASAQSDVNIGGVAIYNDGAELNGIASSVALNYTGDKNSGYYGGMVAYVRKSGAKFLDCHTSGTIYTNGIKYFGGLVGCIEAGTQGTMTDCSNAGAITLDYAAHTMADGHVGGCVGCTVKSSWTFTRVSNTGNIDYNFGRKSSTIYALGGTFGSACGTFEGCFNEGNVTDTDGFDTVSGTRRIGGFAGASAWTGYPIKATRCYNEGNVSGVSNYIGGFMGIAEGAKPDAAAPNEFTDCYNAGDVTVVSKTSISGMFGGFLAVSYQCTNITRCSNRGKIVGFTNRSAGGLIGAGADQLVVDQCENTGMVSIGATEASNPKFGRPFVAGLVAIRGKNPVVITNSKNTGAVTAMVQDASHVQSAYVSEIVTVDGLPDVTACDEATRNASAGASVTAILRPDWTATLPGM